jgi:hypothetical protein
MVAQTVADLARRIVEVDAMFGTQRRMGDDDAADEFVTPCVAKFGLKVPKKGVGVRESAGGCGVSHHSKQPLDPN